MDNSHDISNVSEISFHLSKKPPEMLKSVWPSESTHKLQKPNADSSIFQDNEAISKGLTSHRKKKFSVSKRSSRKKLLILESANDKSVSQTLDIFKTIWSKLTFVTKFSMSVLLNNVKKKRFLKDFKNLRIYHYKIINDQSAEPPKNHNSNHGILQKINGLIRLKNNLEFLKVIFESALNMLSKYTSNINPNSTFKITWDMLLIVLTFIQLFVFSIERSFVVDFEKDTFQVFLLLGFYMDLLITVNTKMFKEGLPVTNIKLIIRNVLSKKLISHLTPSFCLTLIVFIHNKNYEYLNLLLYLKIMRTKKVLQRLKELIVKTRKADAVFQMMILIIRIFCWAHVIAILWHFVGSMSAKNGPDNLNWLLAKKIENKDWTTKYLYSVYWGVTTMLTVGYGDITPTNESETLYNIIAMFFGCGIFGYSMNKIGEI